MNLVSTNQLKQAKENRKLLYEVIAQLKKDFGLYDQWPEFKLSESHAYGDLLEQLTQIIEQILHANPSRFFAILYVVDLPEKKIRSILFNCEKDTDAVDQISQLIIERELLKVLTKKHFSADPN